MMRRENMKNNETVETLTQKVDECEKLKLKVTKKNRDFMELVEWAEREVREVVTQSPYLGNELCQVSNQKKRDCRHCAMGSRYQEEE